MSSGAALRLSGNARRCVDRVDAAYAEPVNIAVATDPSGNVGHSWGKARTVAIAHIAHGRIESWDEFDVGWDQSHDSGTHGSHHAAVARFLKEHEVTVVLVTRVGDGMARMLHTMGVRMESGITGDARAAVERAAMPARDPARHPPSGRSAARGTAPSSRWEDLRLDRPAPQGLLCVCSHPSG